MILSQLRPALVSVLFFTALTGLALPLGMAGAAAVLAPEKAGGSLVLRRGQPVGSILIGQDFTGAGWFHPRPSATTEPDPNDPSKTVPVPYAADNSGASNLAPTARALLDRVRGDLAALHAATVPVDAVTTSGSGLDPDISPDNAATQVARVAASRHLSEQAVGALVAAQTHAPLLGFIGEARVNVLALNLALDRMQGGASSWAPDGAAAEHP